MLTDAEKIELERLVMKSMDWTYDETIKQEWAYPTQIFWGWHHASNDVDVKGRRSTVRAEQVQTCGKLVWIVFRDCDTDVCLSCQYGPSREDCIDDKVPNGCPKIKKAEDAQS